MRKKRAVKIEGVQVEHSPEGLPRPSQGFARSAAGNDYFVLPRSLRATFWRDFAETYARTAYFGNISVFCTLRAGKTRRRVHFASISPEKPDYFAREYKIRSFRHSSMLTAFRAGWVADGAFLRDRFGWWDGQARIERGDAEKA